MPSTPATTTPSTNTTLDDGGAPPRNEDGSGGVKAMAARVADEAPAQAARVAEDARSQLTGAAQRTLTELRSQADDRTAQASRSLRDLSVQVDALANGRPDEAGNVADVAKSIGQHAADFADRLDARGVQGVADDLARFARQHPWTFLGLSLGAGFLVGRLVRTTAVVVSDGEGGEGQLRPSGSITPNTMQAVSPSNSDIRPSTSSVGQ